MYFGIKTIFNEVQLTRDYLLSFKEFETTENFLILKFDLKGLRKLKILSLHDQKIKGELETLQHLLNDKTKINAYGDKMPVSESASTGTSGVAGPSGIVGISRISGSSGTDYLSTVNEIFNMEISAKI